MAGGKKSNDEDDEDFMDMDDDEDHGDEDELDDELALPDVLADISYNEKKELFTFKKSHTGVEWEEEVLRRTDLLTRKIDMERLQRMAMGTGTESSATAAAVAKRGGKPLRGKAATKAAPGRKRKIEDEDEEDEDEDDEPQPQQRRRSNRAAAVTSRSKKSRSKVENSDGEDEEEEDEDEGRVSEEGSDDDDLFDSDEEKEMSTRFKTEGATAMDDDEDEDEQADRPQGRGRLKKASRGRGAAKAKKEKVTKKKVTKTARAKWGAEEGEEGEEEEAEVEEEEEDVDEAGDFDSDDDDVRGRREIKEEVDESPPATLIDYQKIQLRREMLERWVNEPYFEKAVVGYYVRICVGEIEGQNVYRMCEIKGVHKGRKYTLTNKEKTDTRLTLAIGNQVQKDKKISLISGSRINEREFAHYKGALENQRGWSLLTTNATTKRRKDLIRTLKHTYTGEEIDGLIKKRSGYKSLVITTDEVSAKANLDYMLKQAVERREYDKMDDLTKAIQVLDEEIAIHREQAHLMAHKVCGVNQRNKLANVAKDAKAGTRRKELEREAAEKGDQAMLNDPFIRRETRPTILWNTGKKLQDAKDGKDSDEAAAAAASKVAVVKEVAAAKDRDRTGAAEEMSLRLGDVSLEEVRKRVQLRLGLSQDPYAAAREDRRERYLRKACMDLPPADSAEREALRARRDGISLQTWRSREEEGEEAAAAAAAVGGQDGSGQETAAAAQ